MFTKQFHTIHRAIVTGETFQLTIYSGESGDVTLPDTMANGYVRLFTENMIKIPFLMTKDLYTTKLFGSAPGGVCFGTGTTAPTENDYTITQKVLSASIADVSATVTQNGTEYTGTYTISNIGTENITITEVGLFGSCPWNTSSGYCYLIDRTLLDEPLTIEPDSTGKIVYTISIP